MTIHCRHEGSLVRAAITSVERGLCRQILPIVHLCDGLIGISLTRPHVVVGAFWHQQRCAACQGKACQRLRKQYPTLSHVFAWQRLGRN